MMIYQVISTYMGSYDHNIRLDYKYFTEYKVTNMINILRKCAFLDFLSGSEPGTFGVINKCHTTRLI